MSIFKAYCDRHKARLQESIDEIERYCYHYPEIKKFVDMYCDLRENDRVAQTLKSLVCEIGGMESTQCSMEDLRSFMANYFLDDFSFRLYFENYLGYPYPHAISDNIDGTHSPLKLIEHAKKILEWDEYAKKNFPKKGNK